MIYNLFTGNQCSHCPLSRKVCDICLALDLGSWEESELIAKRSFRCSLLTFYMIFYDAQKHLVERASVCDSECLPSRAV